MAKTTTETVTVTGVVERAELLKQTPFRPLYYGDIRERYEYRLDVALRLEDGQAVYFKSPAGRMSVGAAPGIAVVVYSVEGGAREWMREERPTGDAGACATPGKPNTNHLVPLVKVGDTITVTGRVKARKTSRKGKPYVVLTHVFKG